MLLQRLTSDPLIDILLYIHHILCDMEEESDGPEHHTTVGVTQTIIQYILRATQVRSEVGETYML